MFDLSLSLEHRVEMDAEGHLTTDGASSDTGTPRSSSRKIQHILHLVQSDDPNSKLEAAKEIRRLTKTSQWYRRQFSVAVEPLVRMLYSDSEEINEAALLAILNLSVKDEINKIGIVEAGALEPIIGFLRSDNQNLQEHATVSLLTLSASSVNKPVITSSGAIPLLVGVLENGSRQAKVDSVMALYNLSTYAGSLGLILHSDPVPHLVNLLKTCRKSSKAIEKCTALVESIVNFEEGRTALISEEGGVLAVVEVLESGSLQSREHAVGTLLSMCEVDRCKYRGLILGEGVIPGLLELTVHGTAKAQANAKTLLQLLRDSPYDQRRGCEVQANSLENIVCDMMSEMDSDDHRGKAKQMLTEMVQVSMEQSLRHLQQRAAIVCTPADLPITSCSSFE